MNLNQVTHLTEKQARMYLESILWPNEPICPHCKNEGAWAIKGKTTRKGLYKCKDCRKPFTVTTGTIMHRSHITLRQWVLAFHLMVSSKKGVSALQLQRNLGLGTYRSAWHLAHRIRLAMQETPLRELLKGVIEVDETYVGGKPRKEKGAQKSKRGRGTKKAPVLALIERDGKAIAKPVENVTGKTLKGAIRELCAKDSTINTDEFSAYQGVGKDFTGGHRIVRHSLREYVNAGASTNTAESFFALLKRGVYGTFHHISKKHLHRYCHEFSFRWNNRKMQDGERNLEAIKGMMGKRLIYKAM